MRTLCLLLILACFAATGESQLPADVVAPEDASFNAVYADLSIPKVTGKLLNLSPDDLKNLTISYTLTTPFAQFQERKTVSPHPDGSFTLALNYPLPYQEILLELGNIFYTSIYANKALYLELDLKKIKAAKSMQFDGAEVRYLGADGPMNEYLNNFILYKTSEKLEFYDKIGKLMQFSRAAPDSTSRMYHTLYDSLAQIEDSYITANPSPYSWIISNERMSDYYLHICSAYLGKSMSDSLWEKIKQHKPYLVSIGSAEFYIYLNTYVTALPGNSNSIDRSIQRLDSLFPPAKADLLKLRLSTGTDMEEKKSAMADILGSMKTPWCITIEKTQYKLTVDKVNEINKLLAASAGGAPHTSFGDPLIHTSFGASLYKTSGKATDFLAKLKQSFPGKAIIIDRWATWCGACLDEMPYSKALQEDSKDMPVIFVYLCTIEGTTEGKWKSKVAELKQPGIHFLIDKKLDAELSRYFSFDGYPGYALLDRGGNYRPGAIQLMSGIENKDALAVLIH